MQIQQVPDELMTLRMQIDRIDEDMLNLLAERFAVTAKVGELKAKSGLDSVDSVREHEKLERLRELADARSLNSKFILDMFQTIFDEVVKNHRSYLDRA
jgi:chorismate mutase